MISELEMRLSIVPRWVVVHTIQKQSVAEHSFNVALMAPRIAEKIWGWDMKDPRNASRMYALQRCALLHDQMESVTGDIPAITNGHVNLGTVERIFAGEVREFAKPDTEMYNIVKTADLLEAALFMAVEVSMGNNSANKILGQIQDKLKAHLGGCHRGIHFKKLALEIYNTSIRQVNPMVP